MMIRPEEPADCPAVAQLNCAAFGGTEEAELVDRLRRAGLVAASLIAEEDGEIIGHILLSRLKAEIEGRPIEALALAPMSVTPSRQRQGVGSALVEAAIAAARDHGAQAIFVLGHTAFYPRFGFSSQKAALFDNPFNINAFMALELAPETLRDRRGSVLYPPAFGLQHLEESSQNEP